MVFEMVRPIQPIINHVTLSGFISSYNTLLNTFSSPCDSRSPTNQILHEGLMFPSYAHVVFYMTWTAVKQPAGQPTRNCHMELTSPAPIRRTSTADLINAR